MEHTAGPWQIDPDSTTQGANGVYIEAGGQFIAEVGSDASKSEAMANALLIVTAPELLEYLKESHQDEIDHKHYGDGKKGCSYCEVIARAEGKVKHGKA